jgi:hypothetical protein
VQLGNKDHARREGCKHKHKIDMQGVPSRDLTGRMRLHGYAITTICVRRKYSTKPADV